jgi:molybdate transport system substrate-binding protein
VAAARRLACAAAGLVLGWSTVAGAEELVAAGAVSLREPLTRIARSYEARTPGTRVHLTFGASSLLAAQVRAGAPIDVFVSADQRIVEGLAAEGLVAPDGRAALAGNRLVVMAAPDLQVPLARAADLRDPRIRRIAIPDGAVPVGRYARSWLGQRGLLPLLEPRLVPTEHARATLAAVDSGNADAAIVYATDARVARSARVAFEVPSDEQPHIVYAAARISGARPGAEALFHFLLGPEARAALAAAGFRSP